MKLVPRITHFQFVPMYRLLVLTPSGHPPVALLHLIVILFVCVVLFRLFLDG